MYFKLLQAIHHAEITERSRNTANFPVGMLRQVQKFTSFIKPSSPNNSTATKIKENTHKWMMNNISILHQHYEEVIATILTSLPAFDQKAMEKAILFGKIRYKHKLASGTTKKFSELIHKEKRQNTHLTENMADHSEMWPPLPPAGIPSGRLLSTFGPPTAGTTGPLLDLSRDDSVPPSSPVSSNRTLSPLIVPQNSPCNQKLPLNPISPSPSHPHPASLIPFSNPSPFPVI